MKQGREARSQSVGLQPETTPHPQLNPTDTELDRRNARENSEAHSWGSPQPWRATDCVHGLSEQQRRVPSHCAHRPSVATMRQQPEGSLHQACSLAQVARRSPACSLRNPVVLREFRRGECLPQGNTRLAANKDRRLI